MTDIGMRHADHKKGIEVPRRGFHRWFLATLVSLAVCTLLAFLVLDPEYRMRIGIIAAAATALLLLQWLRHYARAISDKEDWLHEARRHDERAEDECEVYYVDLGEAPTPTGAMVPKRFQLGTSRSRAELLAAVITGIWNRHGKKWTPKALEEVAAAFRAEDDELARVAEKTAEPAMEVRILKR